MFLGYQRICAQFTHKAFAKHKDTRVPSYLVFMMSTIVSGSLILSSAIQVGRRPKMLRGFTSSMN